MLLQQLNSALIRRKLAIYFRHNQAKFGTKRKPKPNFFYQTRQSMIPSKKFFVWQDFNAQESTSSSDDCFIQIAFDFDHEKKINERIYMKRPYGEEFSRTKTRLMCKLKNNLKQIDQNEEDNIIQPFTETDEIISDKTSNFNVFFGPNQCGRIKIADTEYSILRDTVWLDKVEIVLDPLVGCPIMPSTDWKNKTDAVNYHWFVSESKKPLNIQIVDSPKCRIHMDGWEYAGTGFYYCPTEMDVGKYLAVVVDVGEEGISMGAICAKQIQQPEEFIFEGRQSKYCGQMMDGNRFRVLSYNVLAHLYLKDCLKKKDQADQYYRYCPKEFQFEKFRYPILMRELPGYNADLLFLQEVDFRFQRRFLVPFLQSKGLTPIFNSKENQVNEGLVVAFKSDRFQMVGNYSIKLSKLLENPFNADIMEFLKTNETISNVLQTRPTIIQLVHLRTTNGLDILAGNTHLHFDPAHEEVKILQSLLCLRYISSFIDNKICGQSPQVLFAGDFNCQPNSAAIRMLQGQLIHLPLVQPTFIQRLLAFAQRNFFGNAKNTGRMAIREPINFQCVSGFPDYTNYTQTEDSKGFVGCLDYIWAHPPLQVDFQVPMPEHQLVTKYGAIPSKICPSDHLPLIADLTFPQPKQNH